MDYPQAIIGSVGILTICATFIKILMMKKNGKYNSEYSYKHLERITRLEETNKHIDRKLDGIERRLDILTSEIRELMVKVG